MTEPLELAIAGAARLAARLRASREALTPLRPFNAAAIEALDDRTAERCDALLKRFENLHSQIFDQMARQVIRAEGGDARAMTRRDVAEWLERFDLAASAAALRAATDLRNRLAHDYPLRPDIQARRIEEALDLAPVLPDAAARAEAWLARRGAGPGPAPP